jgi:hypothetical protein
MSVKLGRQMNQIRENVRRIRKEQQPGRAQYMRAISSYPLAKV